MNKRQLEEYCERHQIWVPPKAPKVYLEAAITRAVYHQNSVERSNCFGHWAKDDPSCMVCDHSEACFEASMGMSKSDYEKKFEALENPRIRFREGMRK